MTQELNEAACRAAFEKWAMRVADIDLGGTAHAQWLAWQAADTSNKRLRDSFIKSIQAALNRPGKAVDKLEFIKALVTKSNATFTESAIKGNENG